MSTQQSLGIVENAELPLPIIQYAESNSTLYPLDAMNGTKAIIAFEGMENTLITLGWAIKNQSEPVFTPIARQGNNSGTIDIDIPWQWVSTCVGHTVLIKYTASVNGQLKTSHTLELEIQHFNEVDLKRSLPVFSHSKVINSTLTLDMNTFVGDETVRIKGWPMMQQGQRLFVTVAGDQHKDPVAFKWVAFDHIVKADEVHPEHVFEFTLSRIWMARRDDFSALTILMAIVFDGTEPTFPASVPVPGQENPLPENAHEVEPRITTLLVVDPVPAFPPAHVKEVVDSVLDPLDTTDGAHIVVDYDGMSEGDRVCPYWIGSPGVGTPDIECRQVQKGETRLEFAVPPRTISANFGRQVTLSYDVTYEGQGPFSSAPGQVIVLTLADLPLPEVTQAVDGTLDLNAFETDATLTVRRWLYAYLGQRIWLSVSGKQEDGTPLRYDVLSDRGLTEDEITQGVTVNLSRDELQAFADNSEVTLRFSANIDNKVNPGSALVFPELVLSLKTQHFIDKVDFNGRPNHLITAGQSIDDIDYMTLSFLSGTGQAGVFLYGPLGNPALAMCFNAQEEAEVQQLQIDFESAYLNVKFIWNYLHLNAELESFDSNGELLQTMILSGASVGGKLHHEVELIAPAGRRIAYLIISVKDYSFLDSFVMQR